MANQNPHNRPPSPDDANPQPSAYMPERFWPQGILHNPSHVCLSTSNLRHYLPSQRFTITQQLYPSLYDELSPNEARKAALVQMANPFLALPVITPPEESSSSSDDDRSIREFVYWEPLFIHPERYLEQEAVQDALMTLRLNSEIIYELRRKYHGNVEISSSPFKPLSKKASFLTVSDVFPGLSEALTYVRERSPRKIMKLIEYLESVGIPESHQWFLAKAFLKDSLKYWSMFILLAVYFHIDLPPPV